MPKFKRERIVIASKHDNVKLFDFNLDVNIDADGHFYCRMPEDVAVTLVKAGVKLEYGSRTNKEEYLYSPTYDGLVKKVRECFTVFTTRELVSKEWVIRYNIQTTCAYGKHGDVYLPNLGCSRELLGMSHDEANLYWRQGTLDSWAANPKMFGFRLYTEVQSKQEFKFLNRPNKIEYVHSCYSGEDLEYATRPELWWLDEIKCNKNSGEDLQEIPGTEDNARFFNALYRYIFGINEKIAYLAKSENLLNFIENNKQLLLS